MFTSLEEAQQAARRGLDDDQFSNRDENPLGGINHALAQLKTMKSALSATDAELGCLRTGIAACCARWERAIERAP